MQASAPGFEHPSFKSPNLLAMRLGQALQVFIPSPGKIQTPTAWAVATVDGAATTLEGLDQFRGRLVLFVDRVKPDQVPTFVGATAAVAEPIGEHLGHLVDRRVGRNKAQIVGAGLAAPEPLQNPALG